jgi:hypothetical protein
MPPMPEIVADLLDPSCYLLFFGSGIQERQPLGPDIFPPRAREAHAVVRTANTRGFCA